MYLQLLFIFSAFSLITAKHYGEPYTCNECKATGCKISGNKTCKGAIRCYASVLLIDEKYVFYRKGCIVHEFVKLARCHYGNSTTEVVNCCEGNFCNDKIPSVPDHWKKSTISPPTTTEIGNEQLDVKETHSVLPDYQFFGLIVIVILAVIIISCFIIRIILSIKKIDPLTKGYDNPALHDSFDNTILPSYSRSSMLTLHQRCMAQDVTLVEIIGKGRFGAVYRGLLHGENVAVKVFSTWNEASWENEVNIYTNIALYHENVLGFKGSVITTRSGDIEMWLLTAYHEQGSLYEYLSESTITEKQMMEFVRCICSGLLHLHTEMIASRGKPSIAHRDLKTRNILLTSYGTCVIADFGLAIVKTNDFPNTENPINYKVGTKRYMAPELLDDSINITNFESFKRTDMYAFGLILWEICSRCNITGTAKELQVAFHDCVPNDPDFEDMKKVVCIELKRPEIPSSWSSNEILNAMTILMKDCWHENPEIRFTVHRVKKILDKINNDMQELQSTAKSDAS